MFLHKGQNKEENLTCSRAASRSSATYLDFRDALMSDPEGRKNNNKKSEIRF